MGIRRSTPDSGGGGGTMCPQTQHCSRGIRQLCGSTIEYCNSEHDCLIRSGGEGGICYSIGIICSQFLSGIGYGSITSHHITPPVWGYTFGVNIL